MAYRTSMIDGKVLIQESGGASVLSSDLEKLFAFLLEDYGECLRICWDLDATVSVFLRLLGRTACRGLQTAKKWHQEPFRVFYIPDKVFGVSHVSGLKCNLYGLEQYYPELDEPDVEELQGLGMNLLKELRKMGFEPTKLTSPVAIYEESILKDLDLPSVKDAPKEVLEYAYNCQGRLWVEAHVLSYFEQVWDYDIQSCFPSIAKNLADFRDFTWIQSSEYHEKAIYGFVKAEIDIFDWVMVSPIIKDEETALISPVGKWESYLTKSEIDFINRWQIGRVSIIDGWWAITTRKAFRKPLFLPLERLLKYKQGNELQRLLAKRMSTGAFYGKFGEERADEFGPYFNPIWFSAISTEARLQVADFLYSHNIGPGDNEGYSHLLCISVDGFMLDCPIEEVK